MAEEKKEGFSYISPEKQKREAVRLFVVEIAVLILVIIGIAVLLVYLNVIPIEKYLTQLFPSNGVDNSLQPQNNNIMKGRNSLTPTIAVVKPEFAVTSDVPNVKLVLKDKEGIIKLLQSWNLYGYSYSDELAGNTKGLPLKAVKVILTPQEKKIFSVKDSEGIYVSSEYKFDNQTLNLFIYLAPRILSDKAKANSTFNYQMLFSLLALAKNAKTVDMLNDVLQQTQKLIDSQRTGNTFFVKIE